MTGSALEITKQLSCLLHYFPKLGASQINLSGHCSISIDAHAWSQPEAKVMEDSGIARRQESWRITLNSEASRLSGASLTNGIACLCITCMTVGGRVEKAQLF